MSKGERTFINSALGKFTGKTAPQRAAATDATTYPVPPSRRRAKAMTVWQDEAAIKQLKELAVERNASQQKLVAEALNLLFSRYGKPPIA